VSTGDTSSDGHSAQPAKPRDVRDRPLFRIAAIVVVLLAAFLATKSCARRADEVSQSEAIAIAKAQVDFTPDKVQIRYVPQGLPPVYYWAVSLYTLRNGQPNRVQVVLVNATTGAVRRT
jgi:Peptidase propeptide and YPEB domain